MLKIIELAAVDNFKYQYFCSNFIVYLYYLIQFEISNYFHVFVINEQEDRYLYRDSLCETLLDNDELNILVLKGTCLPMNNIDCQKILRKKMKDEIINE